MMSTGPPKIIVVAQSLLYVSLFTTLLAALLAVLGKQWVMYYQAAGSRGTIEERGRERQRKLDGLRKWKFDAVLQMFPLLQQFALLLFATALSVYLWTVHHTIAIIIQTLTFVGVAAYILLLVSAVVAPDSPFQTPLAPLLVRAILPILGLLKRCFIKFNQRYWGPWFRYVASRIHILPFSISTRSTKNGFNSLDPYGGLLSPPSVEAPAVLWVLETSTDPVVGSLAAEMVVDLTWPMTLDPRPAMARLDSMLFSCFRHYAVGSLPTIRDGMLHRAITVGRAYSSLRLIARATNKDQISQIPIYFNGNEELQQVLLIRQDDVCLYRGFRRAS